MSNKSAAFPAVSPVEALKLKREDYPVLALLCERQREKASKKSEAA